MLLTIVVPLYNESAGLNAFHAKHLLPALAKLDDFQFEIIYVNDGSKDNTLELVTEIAKNDTRIKVVSLSRNFGKEIAVTAGIATSTGDATIIMDSDGQHPPAILKKFIDKWQAGAQVVIGVRKSNSKEGIVKKVGSKIFYLIFNSSVGAEIVPGSTDYRLIDKAVQAEFIKFTERNRITRGLIDWLGFKRDYIYFDAPARISGDSSYRFSRLAALGINSLTSLSLKPLFLFGWLGVLITGLSLLTGIFIIIEQLILNDPLGLNFTNSGMLGVFISFLIGLVLTSQGAIAVYLSHVHAQTQARPLYVVDKAHSTRN